MRPLVVELVELLGRRDLRLAVLALEVVVDARGRARRAGALGRAHAPSAGGGGRSTRSRASRIPSSSVAGYVCRNRPNWPARASTSNTASLAVSLQIWSSMRARSRTILPRVLFGPTSACSLPLPTLFLAYSTGHAPPTRHSLNPTARSPAPTLLLAGNPALDYVAFFASAVSTGAGLSCRVVQGAAAGRRSLRLWWRRIAVEFAQGH